jgi:4-hydroxybenzoate polyprenyltransferase
MREKSIFKAHDTDVRILETFATVHRDQRDSVPGALFFFGALGWTMGLGPLYWVGVVVVAGLFVYEHRLVSPTDLSRLDVAFFNVNGYIALILFAAVLGGRLF